MAVYTDVGDEELEAFMADYGLGDILTCKGIAEGVEFNFLVTNGRPLHPDLVRKTGER